MNLTANIMPRRTCDKHGWDGGGDCPWCENETLRKRLEEAEMDVERMDYLEGEELSRGDVLFRRNIPITRALVDTARNGEEP